MIVAVVLKLFSGVVFGASPTNNIGVVRAAPGYVNSGPMGAPVYSLDLVFGNLQPTWPVNSAKPAQQQFSFSMSSIPMGPNGVAGKRYLSSPEFVDALALESVIHAQGDTILLRNSVGDLVVWRPAVQQGRIVADDVLAMDHLSRSEALLLMRSGALAALDSAGTLRQMLPPHWLSGVTGNITGIAVAEVISLTAPHLSLYGITDAGEVFYVEYDGGAVGASAIKEFAKLTYPRIGKGPVKDDIGNIRHGMDNGIEMMKIVCQRGRYPRFAVLAETINPSSGSLTQYFVSFLNSGFSAIRWQAAFVPGHQLGQPVAGPFTVRTGSNRTRGAYIDAELLGYAKTMMASDRIYVREDEDLVSYDGFGTSRRVEEQGLFSDATMAAKGGFASVMAAQHTYAALPAPALPMQIHVSTPAVVLAAARASAAAASAPAATPKPRNILLEDPTTAQGWVDYLRAEVAKVDREYGFNHSRNLSARLTTRRSFMAAVNSTQVFL